MGTIDVMCARSTTVWLCGLAACLTLAGASGSAWAQAAEQGAARQGVASGRYKPLNTLLAELVARDPGKVVHVEARRGPLGELRYDVTHVDPKGRTRQLLLDAATGQVLPRVPPGPQQAVPLATLAHHVRQVEQQTGARVIEAELKRDRGQANYLLKPAPAAAGASRLRIDARSGEVVSTPDPASRTDGVRAMADELQALSRRFDGLVLDVELEDDDGRTYYEIELQQAGGAKLELHVDARSLAILKQSVDD